MEIIHFVYGTITLCGALFQESSTMYTLCMTGIAGSRLRILQPHTDNGLTLKLQENKNSCEHYTFLITTSAWFGLFRVRSPLLTESHPD